MQKNNYLSIKDLGLSDDNLVKEVGDFGIYFKNRANDVNLQTEIFRYMKLSHLMDMIDNRYLYIPNRNSFTDLRDRLGLEKHITQFLCQFPFKFEINPVASHKVKRWRKQIAEEKEKCMDICISCWTLDKRLDGSVDESFLMWKAYTDKELTCRIATTISAFIDCIKELPCDLVISDVEYNDKGSTYDKLVFQKSRYYDSEHEVRIAALTRGKHHVDIMIDPIELIKGIKTSPFLIPFTESSIINGLRSKYLDLKEIIEPSKVMEYTYL